MVFRSILLIGSSALVIALLQVDFTFVYSLVQIEILIFRQVWGVICALLMAFRVRANKTRRDVLKWNVQNLGLDKPGDLKTKPEDEGNSTNNYI